jgi:hypothetical protein
LQLHEPAVEKLQKRLTTDQQAAESDSAIEIFQQTRLSSSNHPEA